MQLIVFGATGATGQQIVEQALQRGHKVRALVRDPARLPSHDGLETVTRPGLSADDVAAAFAGPADAVICALGIFHREPRTELSDATRRITQAMQQNNVRRLLVVSSLGVGDSEGQGNFLARMIQRISLAEVLKDKGRQEQVIRDSGLDWTVIRPPRLMNTPAGERDAVDWQGPTPKGVKLTWQTSRGLIAGWLLDALEQDQHKGQAFNISECR